MSRAIRTAAPLLALATAGCPSELPVNIGVLFPEDASHLGSTNNVNITLAPDGFTDQFATDGPDFALEVELAPDDTERELAVYLAQDDTLLGYGRTPRFQYSNASGAGLQVFIAYPESLATLPIAFDLPDATTVAAPTRGYGMVALGGDGSTVFLDRYTFDLERATELTTVPAADDGTFVGDTAGGAVRVSWSEGLAAQRFDVPRNEWTALAFEGTDAAVPRPRAPFIPFGPDRLLLLGGGERTDCLDVGYASEDATPSASPGPAWIVLDAPRHGATAIALDFGGGPMPLLVGGDDPTLPRVLAAWAFAALGDAALGGPAEAWTGLRCVQLDSMGAVAPTHQVLCAGGMRSDAPTPDGLLVTIAADGMPDVVELAALLPAAMADVMWQADDAAVYAQGDGRWVRFARMDLAVSEPPAAAARARGGTSVPFDTGITLVVGGTDIAGAPTNRWQVFAPALSG